MHPDLVSVRPACSADRSVAKLLNLSLNATPGYGCVYQTLETWVEFQRATKCQSRLVFNLRELCVFSDIAV